MAFYCSISNEIPEHPCVSPSSNLVFERRLIEKYILENGCDPMSGEKISVDQLLDLKTNPTVKPKPPTATSIPALLKALQDEWDAVMLHSFTMRQQLQTYKQELSHSLYQHDAACRVIARLSKEANAARDALATLKPQATGAPNVASAVVGLEVPASKSIGDFAETKDLGPQEVGMSEEVLTNLQNKATILTAERKKRGKAVPDGLTPPESIRLYRQVSSYPGLHSVSQPGILCLDVHLADTSRVLTGGFDKNGVVFNRDTEQVIAILKGHTKKVTNVVYHPYEDVALTSSPDRSIRVWSVNTETCSQVIKAHNSAVTGLSLHATGDYVLSCAEDRSWAFSDLHTGALLTKVSDGSSSNQPLTCAKFHPDGLIFGIGTGDAMIKVWDLKERDNVANFPGHSGRIADIAFSENGYYLATAAEDSVVKLWDLRKLKNFKTIQLDDNYEVRSLSFDQSGSYLAVSGTDVRIYLCKQWVELAVFESHTAASTAARWGHDAGYLASTSMDRTLKFYTQA